MMTGQFSKMTDSEIVSYAKRAGYEFRVSDKPGEDEGRFAEVWLCGILAYTWNCQGAWAKLARWAMTQQNKPFAVFVA